MLLKSSTRLPSPLFFPYYFVSNLQILPLRGFYGLERKYYNTYSIFFQVRWVYNFLLNRSPNY